MKVIFIQANTKKEAFGICPWASKVKKVDGGFLCFECLNDYTTWLRQK